MDCKKITVLVVEPEKAPYTKAIDTGLKSLQKEVGGYIEAIYPWADPVAVICNEEGKLEGLPLNRALRDGDGHIYDVVAGTFLVAGLGTEDFCSLTPEQEKKYTKLFHTPELFVNLNGELVVLPMEVPKSRKPSIKEQLMKSPPQGNKKTPVKRHGKEVR